MNDIPLEPDTCRICRGEATVFEPLFHPCKCSGSIKYVHQDCLMNWLSRSRKKHCELCKVSFRFTKLYAADMLRPPSIHLYVSHMTKCVFRSFLVLTRALLVFIVWLCWLPYLIRSVWGYLFMISYKGLSGEQGVFSSQMNFNPIENSALSTVLSKVSTSSALAATTTTDAAIHAAQQTLCCVVPLILDSHINSSTEDGASVVYTESSLLSDTRSFHVSGAPKFNLILKAILEGQIITVLVFACLIPVIRIRDFVVYQQSETNARPTRAAPDNRALPQHLAESRASFGADNIDKPRGPGDLDRENIEARETAVVLDDVLESRPSVASQPNYGGTLSPNENFKPTNSFLGGLSQDLLVDEFGGSGSHAWECLPPALGTPAESYWAKSRDQRSQIFSPYVHRDLGDQVNASMTHDCTDIPPQTQGPQTTTERGNVPNLSELEAARRPTSDVTHAQSQQHTAFQRLADSVWQSIATKETNKSPLATDVVTDFPDNNASFDVLQGEDSNPETGERVREVIEAAAASRSEAGLDTEAIEGSEGLSHSMGMIGMRGPVAELLLNGIHCTFLASFSIFMGIFLPYNIGSSVIRLVVKLLFGVHKSVQCVAPAITATFPSALGSSHRLLLTIKWHTALVFANVVNAMLYLFGKDLTVYIAGARSFAVALALATWTTLKKISTQLSWTAYSDRLEAITAINHNLAYRAALDRVWAILVGYLCIISIAELYLRRRGGPFSTSQVKQEWEISVIKSLNQGSSVMKVILITGIEMLGFPLFCGILIDTALLPAFEDTSVYSRILFTANSPVTSISIHWFVGIGYMYYVSRFIAICRKTMRNGILSFIRDPGDPEFHPVREILETNCVTQLRAIFFSGFVYGALIFICLGGVVWGLSFFTQSILPIHYSFDEPTLTFLIPLLFHSSLVPLRIKLLKPSDGLHAVCTWWARALRISWFLLGVRQIDEEGTLVLAPDSPYRATARWQRQLLGLTDAGEVIPKAWRDTFKGEGRITSTIALDDMICLEVKKAMLVQSQQLIPNGHFVCYPAVDKVKTAGSMCVLEVSRNNFCMDGKSGQLQFVYIPPNLRIRVVLFIFFVWISFIAGGVGFTVIPLGFGRQVLHLLLPSHIRVNDIHAFSIGIFAVVSITYTFVYIRSLPMGLGPWTGNALLVTLHRDSVRHVAKAVAYTAKIAYLYAFLLIISPVMASSLMENYILIPFNAYFWSDTTSSIQAQDPSSLGIQGHAIEAWDIGVLCLMLGARIIASSYPGSHLTAAIHAILQHGLVDPDITYVTREFIIPGLILWCLAHTGPPILARLFIKCGRNSLPPTGTPLELINCMSFPIAGMLALIGFSLWNLIKIFKRWQATVRGEAQLIGQRLQNFDIGASNTDLRVRNPRTQSCRSPSTFYRLVSRISPLRIKE